MKLKVFGFYILGGILLALLLNGLMLSRVNNLQTNSSIAQQHRLDAILLTQHIAQEVKQLEQFVKAYTSTGHVPYLLYYYDIIAIRQGTKKAPENYDSTYWARVTAGEIQHQIQDDQTGTSLLDKMKTLQFSDEELAALSEIMVVSEAMAQIEQIAFAATQGLYDPILGDFVDDGEPQLAYAGELINSQSYLELASELAKSIQALTTKTSQRTSQAVQNVTAELNRSILYAIASLLLTLTLVLFSLYIIFKRVLSPLEVLLHATKQLERGNYSTRANVGVAVVELNSLSATFNQMANSIELDVEQRAQYQLELEAAKAKADEATKAKSMFLANMSHEIRTPMNAIIGMAYLLLRTKLDARQEDYAGKVHIAAKSLLGIINDILDFSKVEAGKLSLEEVNFNLESVIANSLIMVKQKASEKQIELLFDVRDPSLLGERGQFIGDPLRLGQILTNLLSNAVKFTEQGYVKLSVSQKDLSASTELTFCLEDTGIGMSEEQVGRLFQEFSQADGSTTRKYGGTGLGLVISKRLIELMGGQVVVESKVGSGSTFRFSAHFTKPTPNTHQSTEKADKKIGLPNNGFLTALVVDDQEAARRVMADMLANFGIQSQLAASGSEALECIKKTPRPFDFYFIDWVMPEMNGEELLQALKDLPEAQKPVVVVASAYDSDELHDKAQALGVHHFLSKPVLPDQLRRLLDNNSNSNNQDSDEQDTSTELLGMRVLLVEDNEVNQQLAQELLADRGVEVVTASNGQIALDILNKEGSEGFSVVLMDLQMPVLDGYEATRRLRENPRFDALPILAMTAHAMLEERTRCESLGMNGHITKPIEPELLYTALQAHYKAPGHHKKPDTPKVQKNAPELALGSIDFTPLTDAGIKAADGLRRSANKIKLYKSLLSSYLKEFHDLVKDLKSKINSNKPDDAARLAHTFKGLSGSIGATELYTLGAILEDSFQKEDIDNINLTLTKLENTFPAYLKALCVNLSLSQLILR